MLYLIQGPVQPGSGIYLYNNLSQSEFTYACREGRKQGVLRCKIVDRSLCDLLSQVAGVMILPPVETEDKDGGKIKLEDGDQIIFVQVNAMRSKLVQTPNNGDETIELRTTLATHFNDNVEGIMAMLGMYATESTDAKLKEAYSNAMHTLEYGLVKNDPDMLKKAESEESE